MELRQIEYFLALSQELHFTNAADKLGISQPTLSHQIKVLENEIGFPLFDRVGKKIIMTEVGMIMYEQCTTVISALENAKEKIHDLQQLKNGSISIAALPGELTDLVSTLILHFHELFPYIKVSVVSTDDIEESIKQNKVDFALSIVPESFIDNEKVMNIPLYEEEFYLAVSKQSPIARKNIILFSELKNLPLILFPEKHQCRKLLDQTCITSAVSLSAKIETSSISTILGLVHKDQGVTVVSKTLLDMYADYDLAVIPIINPTISREVSIVLRKDKFMNFATRKFIELLKREVIKLDFPISQKSWEELKVLTRL